jgi:hypothetical protein
MILRLALFLTLVGLFYYYCADEDSSNDFRSPNDINMIEVPDEFSPRFIDDSQTAFSRTPDTLQFSNYTYSFRD